ncbi:MAG: hypothetical protein U0790_28055 [Isosphaeraceae bacterium]
MSKFRTLAARASFAGAATLAFGLLAGCGEGERMQTGTQVQVSDDLLKEAHAQDEYFDAQKKAGKGAAKQPSAEKDGPGAAPPSK